MSTEISVPFALDITGQVATTADPDAQATQHVTALVSTTPGERVMQPDYGVSLLDFVFDDNFGGETAMIQNDVATAMAKWEPTLTLDDVEPVGSPEIGVVSLNVQFTRQPGATSAPLLTATIVPGGTVIQDGQGS